MLRSALDIGHNFIKIHYKLCPMSRADPKFTLKNYKSFFSFKKMVDLGKNGEGYSKGSSGSSLSISSSILLSASSLILLSFSLCKLLSSS